MDGGRSWVVLLAALVVYTLALGMITAYGVYFAVFIDLFGVSMSQAVVVSSVMYSSVTATAPISAFFYRRLGTRITVMTGGLVASTGYSICYLASNLREVAFVHGLIGFGFGLTIIPIWSVHTEYFDRFRNLAMGVLAAGGGLGLFVFPPIFTYMVNKYTWRGSMLVNAGIALHVVVAGALMKPIKQQRWTRDVQRSSSYQKLFSSSNIFLFALCALCWAGSSQIFYQIMPTLAKQRGGLETNRVVWITSAVGLTDIAARLSAAWLNHTCFRRHTVFLYAAAMFVDAFSLLAFCYCRSYEAFLAVGIIFGLSFGLMLGSHGASAFDVFGLEQFPDVIGVASFACSIGGLTGPVLAGYLGDVYGIAWTFRFAALMALTGSLSCFSLAVRKTLTMSKQSIKTAAA